jgi:hypothetical protein
MSYSNCAAFELLDVNTSEAVDGFRGLRLRSDWVWMAQN